MKGRGDAPSALRRFLDEVGLPSKMVSDNASEVRSAKWKEILNEFGVRERSIESYSPHSNYAENTVKVVKFSMVKLMEGRGIPIELWDYVIVYA